MVFRPLKASHLVEVAVVERGQRRLELVHGPADIDDDPVRTQVRATKLDIDREGGAMQLLRRPEHLALEAVRDHDVVPDPDAEHARDLPRARQAAG